MAGAAEIHFGHFVRARRSEAGLTLKEFAGKVGITEKRLWQIEKMPEPVVNERTLYGIARAMGLTLERLDASWRTTPAPEPMTRKAGIAPGRMKVVRLPADLVASLELLAGERNQSLADYLQEHVENRRMEIHTAANPPAPQEAGSGLRTQGAPRATQPL